MPLISFQQSLLLGLSVAEHEPSDLVVWLDQLYFFSRCILSILMPRNQAIKTANLYWSIPSGHLRTVSGIRTSSWLESRVDSSDELIINWFLKRLRVLLEVTKNTHQIACNVIDNNQHYIHFNQKVLHIWSSYLKFRIMIFSWKVSPWWSSRIILLQSDHFDRV